MIPKKGEWSLPTRALRPSAPRCARPQQNGRVGGQNEGGFGGVSPPKSTRTSMHKCRVGGQKHGGAWGGLPPKIESRFNAQCGCGGSPPQSKALAKCEALEQEGAVGGEAPRKNRTSPAATELSPPSAKPNRKEPSAPRPKNTPLTVPPPGPNPAETKEPSPYARRIHAERTAANPLPSSQADNLARIRHAKSDNIRRAETDTPSPNSDTAGYGTSSGQRKRLTPNPTATHPASSEAPAADPETGDIISNKIPASFAPSTSTSFGHFNSTAPRSKGTKTRTTSHNARAATSESCGATSADPPGRNNKVA